MRKKILAALATVLAAALVLALIPLGIRATMPAYPHALAADNATQKITGTYLVSEAASQPDSLLIFGSSELKTTDICTHPANFFADSGLQVDLVGRGSCQSIIHALAIGAQGETLRGKKIVLITAPQSYVEDGIAPDLFLANCSAQLLLDVLLNDEIPDETRTYLAKRVWSLGNQQLAGTGENPLEGTAAWELTKAWQGGNVDAVRVFRAQLARYFLDAKDMVASRRLIADAEKSEKPALDLSFDWEAAEAAALAQAAQMVTNNDYYMQDSYYSTYIGARYAQQAGKDAALSYAESPEYGDLKCLLDLCKLFEVELLFVHVPMNGSWNDYTGFSAGRRAEYYENVKNIVNAYDNVTLLDLTGNEYDPYFLCDTMHLGWKGWLAVDRAIVDFVG